MESTDSDTTSTRWPIFGKNVPKSEIVFFTQVIILYTVIIVSIYNLSVGKGSDLWVALLSSSLGYILPAPQLKKNK
jgi:hypothetical protein